MAGLPWSRVRRRSERDFHPIVPRERAMATDVSSGRTAGRLVPFKSSSIQAKLAAHLPRRAMFHTTERRGPNHRALQYLARVLVPGNRIECPLVPSPAVSRRLEHGGASDFLFSDREPLERSARTAAQAHSKAQPADQRSI